MKKISKNFIVDKKKRQKKRKAGIILTSMEPSDIYLIANKDVRVPVPDQVDDGPHEVLLITCGNDDTGSL